MDSTTIDSAPTAEEGESEDYSLCVLFAKWVSGAGYSFEHVFVNEGFQNRDFQTKQGTVCSSVIDPELLGKIRKEAADIYNMDGKRHLYHAVIFGPCLCLALLFFGRFWLRPDVDMLTDSIIVFSVSYAYWMISGFCISCWLSTKTASLVESYQPTFRQECGIELGYGRFKVPPQNEDSPVCPCIYLGRSRQLVDDEEAPVVGHDCKEMDTFFPPIYVTCLIPGEVHIEEKEYDAAALMSVDSDMWSLLQSTHQTMTRCRPHPIVICFAILVFLAVWLVFICLLITPYFGFLNVSAFIFIVGLGNRHAVDNHTLAVFKEVTKVVNSTLQNDETKAHLALEFHDSELPGREGTLSLRYQFVLRAEQQLIPVHSVCKVTDEEKLML